MTAAVERAARELRRLGDHVGPAPQLQRLDSRVVRALPEDHLALLTLLNGVTVYHGAFRLLGVRDEPSLDLETWNERETWRFAWDERIEPFLMFAETGWGDQYAYRQSPDGGLERGVYFLEATMLRHELAFESFEDFLVTEFLRNATEPYDEMTSGAYEKLGPLAPDRHWALAPPLAVGGVESLDNVVELPAIAAMTFSGDIATALRTSRPGTSVTGMVPVTDDRGRARLRVETG